MQGRVLKVMGANYLVYESKPYNCILSGLIKKNNKPLVGDIVEFSVNDYDNDKNVITKILPRKNQLVRPYISNLDQLFIVLSKSPKPDYLLIDKLIIYAKINNITPIIVINKSDILSEQEIAEIKGQFPTYKIVVVSAINKDVTELKQLLVNKISAFAGQSAVGKSSLINAISPNLNLQTNGLSSKIERGQHTTRHNEIYIMDNNIYIADTPGFSMLSLDLKPSELKDYYDDFKVFENDCRYVGCDHINSKAKDCGVVKAVEEGKICLSRFDRYCKIYSELKEKWERKYD